MLHTVRACAEISRHSGNSVALAYTLNYRNVRKFRRMREQCVPGLPSPCGRLGNEAVFPVSVLLALLVIM